MGMDVYGVAPTSDKGEYFRASIWAWCPIHQLICEVSDAEGSIFTKDELRSMAHNDGAPGDIGDERMSRFVVGFERKLSAIRQLSTSNKVAATSMPAVNIGKTLMQALGGNYSDRLYQVDVEHLEEFLEFIRHAGPGFRVH